MRAKEKSNIYLNFATYYRCAIMPFKQKPQNYTICVLLFEAEKIQNGLPISDALCSNYSSGKRPIPDEIRRNVVKISITEFENRLKKIGIYDFEYPVSVLKKLLGIVCIPQHKRESLLELVEKVTPVEFMREVYLTSLALPSNGNALTEDDRLLLKSLSERVISNGYSDLDMDGENLSDSYQDSAIDEEDIEWIREYVPKRIEINTKAFFGTPITINRQVFSLPNDFGSLIYLIKPALTGSPIDTFRFEDFLACTGIRGTTGELEAGRLECWKLIGPVDELVGAIEGLNFSLVSDVVFLMNGKINLEDVKKIENSIKKASNSNIGFLRALCFDGTLKEIEITLIIRIFPQKAQEQKKCLNENDQDVIEYIPHRRGK